jgi:CheY-like chemotaxis protein
LALAKKHRPDVMVVDLNMPGMDGFALCRAIRSDPWLAVTPIILLTSTKSDVVKREALLAGASQFMNKPIDAELLARHIAGYLEEKK